MPDQPSDDGPGSPGDDVTDLVRGLFHRAARRGRRELTKGLDAGRQQIELRQARRDLDAFWIRLGKTAFRLSDAQELDHPAIDKAARRIQELLDRIEALEQDAQQKTPTE